MIPFRLLFWNLGHSAPLELVADLVAEHQADIVILVESKHGLAATVEALNTRTRSTYEIPVTIEDKFHFFTRVPRERIEILFDGVGMMVRRIRPVLGEDFIVCSIHLPSKLHRDAMDQVTLCSRWIRHLTDAEKRVAHRRTVVVGDMNMNPFEPGVVGSEGFHAVSSRLIAAREFRKVLAEERSLFYNPMWSMMGDHAGPPGTFYYASSNPISYFWNTFDQVLLRPHFARVFMPGDIVIPTAVADRSLLNSRGEPVMSDHLPIVATLRLEENANAKESLG